MEEKTVKYILKDGTLMIYLSDRVDSNNAKQVEAEMEEIIAGHPYEHLIFDLSELQYISSAGLRAVLKIRKSNADMKMINASSEVYEIFEMTGFTEMINIEKAKRNFSVEGCEVIGAGANGTVYRLDPETIIKVYKSADCLPEIERERELARKAFVLGIPTAIPYDVVKVGDTYGSVFELLNANSLQRLLNQDIEHMEKYAAIFVDLLHTIHSTEADTKVFENYKDVVLSWLKVMETILPEDAYEKLCRLIREIPDDTHLIHGDYHGKNVMLQNDEVLLIDMDTLAYGNAIFEFAFMYNAYQGFGDFENQRTMDFMGISYENGRRFWRMVLKMYFNEEDEAKIDNIEKKAKVLSYTRLLRRSVRRNLGEDQVNFYRESLLAALNGVDSLLI